MTRLTVVGAGGIGGTVGAYLARGGLSVELVDAEAAHVAAIQRRGLTLATPDGDFTVHPPALTPDQLEGPLGIVLLAVRATDTATAVRSLLPHLSPESFVVSLQNGLNEPIIADLIGSDRTVGAFINFSAEYQEPGRVRFWGTGPFYLGEIDGRESPRVAALADLISRHWGPARQTSNIFGYLWAKEAYTQMLIPIRLVDADQPDVCERRPELMIELAAELIEVALLEGIHLESFSDFEPKLYYPRETRDRGRLLASYQACVDYMRRRQKPRPGSYRQAPAGKPTEVSAALERRLEQAARHGRELPLTRLVSAAVEAARGRQGWELLEELADQAVSLYPVWPDI